MQTPGDICRKVLVVDDSILSVSLMTQEGTLLKFASRGPKSQKFSINREVEGKYPSWVSVYTAIAQQTDKFFGRTEYVMVAHEKFKMAAIAIPNTENLIAFVTDRSVDMDYLVFKIEGLLEHERERPSIVAETVGKVGSQTQL